MVNATFKAYIKEQSWDEMLQFAYQRPSFQRLIAFLKQESHKVIYPPKELRFEAFRKVPFNKVKVVIIGQDPYHGKGQAHGLSFSVNPGVKIPPSLLNIYKELNRDLGCKIANHGCLNSWAEQGVLLLNSILTVEEGKAGSHAGKGWEEFTDDVISTLNENRKNLVFLLWGRFAQEKGKNIDNQKHFVLKSAHPSPLSRNSDFIGNEHFSKTNQYLREHQIPEIDWQIPDL